MSWLTSPDDAFPARPSTAFTLTSPLTPALAEPLPPAEKFGWLIDLFGAPTLWLQALVFVGCLLLAAGLVRLLRGPDPERTLAKSIWFGRNIIDGVLFPLVSLLLVLIARWLLRNLQPMAVFQLGVPILVSLAAIRVTVRVLRSAYPDSRPVRIIERSVSWVAWIAVVLWISGALPLIMLELDSISWNLGGKQVSVRNLLEGALTAVVVLIGALWLSAALEARLLRDARGNVSIRKMAANTLRALLLFIGLMMALSAAGIDLTALGVLGGAIGVGIGFGLQKLAANYISGFVILAERSMRIGDTVKVDNFEGRITDISTRYTVIRALDGRESIVPNEMMITQRVENSSLADPKLLITTDVQVAYGTDLDTLMPRLAAAVASVPRVLQENPPGVLLTGFAADGLALRITFWIADPENGQGNVRSAVNLEILRVLNASGVEIPFPQRVLHQAAEAAPPAPA